MSDREGSNAIMWFLAGLGLGALIGVLYAPRSGRETRQAILDAAEEGRDYLVTKGQAAREQVAEWTTKGKEAVKQQKEQFKAAYEAGRQAYRDTATNPEKS
jgi:gas vesicle protein